MNIDNSCIDQAIIVIYTTKFLNKTEAIMLNKKFTETNRFYILLNTLEKLHSNFITKYNYPIIIMYENYDDTDIINIKKTFPNITFIFEEIKPIIPDFIDISKVHLNIINKPVAHWRNLGYRHMCKFFALDIFKHPIISQYKYYMRIDDDSIIYSDIKCNLFDYMEKHSIDYLYRLSQKTDCNICNEGMKQFFISMGCVYCFNRHMNPFNNFHIIRLDSMKNRKVLNKNEIVENIYYKRWGDAPLHGGYIKLYNLKAVSSQDNINTSFIYGKWGNIYTNEMIYNM